MFDVVLVKKIKMSSLISTHVKKMYIERFVPNGSPECA